LRIELEAGKGRRRFHRTAPHNQLELQGQGKRPHEMGGKQSKRDEAIDDVLARIGQLERLVGTDAQLRQKQRLDRLHLRLQVLQKALVENGQSAPPPSPDVALDSLKGSLRRLGQPLRLSPCEADQVASATESPQSALERLGLLISTSNHTTPEPRLAPPPVLLRRAHAPPLTARARPFATGDHEDSFETTARHDLSDGMQTGSGLSSDNERSTPDGKSVTVSRARMVADAATVDLPVTAPVEVAGSKHCTSALSLASRVITDVDMLIDAVDDSDSFEPRGHVGEEGPAMLSHSNALARDSSDCGTADLLQGSQPDVTLVSGFGDTTEPLSSVPIMDGVKGAPTHDVHLPASTSRDRLRNDVDSTEIRPSDATISNILSTIQPFDGDPSVARPLENFESTTWDDEDIIVDDAIAGDQWGLRTVASPWDDVDDSESVPDDLLDDLLDPALFDMGSVSFEPGVVACEIGVSTPLLEDDQSFTKSLETRPGDGRHLTERQLASMVVAAFGGPTATAATNDIMLSPAAIRAAHTWKDRASTWASAASDTFAETDDLLETAFSDDEVSC